MRSSSRRSTVPLPVGLVRRVVQFSLGSGDNSALAAITAREKSCAPRHSQHAPSRRDNNEVIATAAHSCDVDVSQRRQWPGSEKLVARREEGRVLPTRLSRL